MTAGFHAPLPPARTGVADYATALIAAMRRSGTVRVNADGEANLYHLGNNQLHREIYRRALERPGVAVLHDAVLQHFFLGSIGEAGYVEEFVHNYGEWSRELGRTLWRERARSGGDARYFLYPMLRRIGEASRALVVHNPAAADLVLRHAPGARVHQIPHLLLPGAQPAGYEVERRRRAWSLPPGGVVFGVFGHLRESKRLAAILREWPRVQRAAPEARLLLAGEFGSRTLEAALAPGLAQCGVLRAGRTDESEFVTLIAATDVCLALRYPCAGETSGIAIRAMAAGRAVVLTDTPANARFPETSCVRLEAGAGEAEGIGSTMIWLAGNRAARTELGRRAREYVRQVHDAGAVARLYWDVLQSVQG